MSIINRFPILSKIDLKLKQSIALFSVFGESGGEVIFVTNDDNVFAFGINKNGCLGLNFTGVVELPQRVEQLCGKGVNKIAFGLDFVFALTKSGKLYGWGTNPNGQMGNNTTTAVISPQLISHFNDMKVIDIVCNTHVMALTKDGEVFCWGYNGSGQCGNGTTFNQLIPVKVDGIPQKVVSIACGGPHSIAVTETRELYGWGANSCGELGTGNFVNHITPVHNSQLESIVIKKVCCGFNHTLVLSFDDCVYAFGYYGSSQTKDKFLPEKVANNQLRFTDIDAFDYTSVGITSDNEIYTWENYNERGPPVLSTCGSIYEIYANLNPKITKTSIYLTSMETNNSILNCLADAFNNPSKCNFEINIEGKVVYANKWYLSIRCQHFAKMFEGNWMENKSDKLEIKDYSYPIYHSFLKYIYTNEVNITLEEALELYDLANAYFESELKLKCEQVIKNGVTIDNVAMVYDFANKYKATDLERYCFQIALKNMKKVVQTSAYLNMSGNSAKMLFRCAGEWNAFKEVN